MIALQVYPGCGAPWWCPATGAPPSCPDPPGTRRSISLPFHPDVQVYTHCYTEREREKPSEVIFPSNMRFSVKSNLKLNINTSFQEVKYCSTAMIAGAYIRPPARGLSHRPPPQILPSSAHSGTGASPVVKDRLGDEKCIRPSALVPSPPPLRLGSTYPNSTRTLWRG